MQGALALNTTPSTVSVDAIPAESAPAQRAPARQDPLVDDPASWPSFGRLLDGEPADGLWESHVAVDGMHCAACAFTVEAALAQVPGVYKAEVNAASRRARVVWSAAAGRPSQWMGASSRAGYRLVPVGDVSARARRTRESRVALWGWLVAGFCMMQVMMYAYPAYVAQPGDLSADAAQLLRWASWMLTLPVVLFSCAPFVRSAWRSLRARRIGMDVPVALGMAITFAVSTVATFDPAGPLGSEVYFDSLTMFVFFLLTGRWLEQRLRDRTAGALEALMNRLPESVERLAADGEFVRVAVGQIAVGDIVRVLPGEAFPADGDIVDGDTTVDEAMLSGESQPLLRARGARVLAGSHNLSSAVQVRVASTGRSTRFAGLVALMEGASLDKPRLALMADRVARPFIAATLVAAGVAALVWWPTDPGHALMVAVSVLIVTCPCALSLATPAAMLASAGVLARGGTMVRNLQALESLAGVDTVIFDKTGTLTRDTPRLERIDCRHGLRPGDALEMAAAVASSSLHPSSRALVSAWNAQSPSRPGWESGGSTERPGGGVEAELRRGPLSHGASPQRIRLGSAAFCGVPALDVESLQVHLSDEHGWVASFLLVEDLRADAAATVSALAQLGVTTQLVSGDRPSAARDIAQRAGIAEVQGGCTPEDKLRVVRSLQAAGRRVAMVGDGLNDGPVLAQADASFAFGRAVPLSQARADFIAPGDALGVVAQTLVQARRTMRIVRQNLGWAAGYNALCVPLAIAGYLPAWLAGLGMATSSVVVVLNASRLAVRPAANPL